VNEQQDRGSDYWKVWQSVAVTGWVQHLRWCFLYKRLARHAAAWGDDLTSLFYRHVLQLRSHMFHKPLLLAGVNLLYGDASDDITASDSAAATLLSCKGPFCVYDCTRYSLVSYYRRRLAQQTVGLRQLSKAICILHLKLKFKAKKRIVVESSCKIKSVSLRWYDHQELT